MNKILQWVEKSVEEKYQISQPTQYNDKTPWKKSFIMIVTIFVQKKTTTIVHIY